MNPNLSKTIVVTTPKSLAKAVKYQYGTIILRGNLANQIKYQVRRPKYPYKPYNSHQQKQPQHNNVLESAVKAGAVTGLLLLPILAMNHRSITETDLAPYLIYPDRNQVVVFHQHRSRRNRRRRR